MGMAEDVQGDQAESAEEEAKPIAAGQYVAPVMMRRAFHCVHCGVYSNHGWTDLITASRPGESVRGTPIRMEECFNCRDVTFWLASKSVPDLREDPAAPMIWPWGAATAPLPDSDM